MSFLRRIFGGAQGSPSQSSLQAPEGFKFAHLEWHDTGILTIRFMNAPTPDIYSSDGQQDESRASDEKSAQRLVDGLKSSGWQQFMALRHKEGWVASLLRNSLEPGYDYAVLSAVRSIRPEQPPGILRVEGLFRLGRQNQDLRMPGNVWQFSYDETLNYLEQERWTFVNEEDYPYYGIRSNQRMALRWS